MKERIMKEGIAKYLTQLLLKRRKNFVVRPLIAVFSMYRKATNALAKSDNKTISRTYLQFQSLKRTIIGGKYNFVAINELVAWTTEWINSFPTTYDMIVGIPRSGLLVANLISLKLGKPVTTPELFNRDHYWMSERMNKKGEYKNILLVDDSITSGKRMEEALRLLHSGRGNFNTTKAALITTQDSRPLVDLCYKVVEHPRIFEWNLLHAKKGKLASDLDGVICENCPPGIDSNEILYSNWIKTAKPYLIPVFEIDAIVSSRLEKYRFDTEEWLTKHEVRYKELILWDIRSKEERNGKHAQHKTEHLLKIKPDMFWESSFAEAKQIWEVTKIPTLCIEKMILFG